MTSVDDINWQEVIDEAKQNRLGTPDDAPVSKGNIVAALRSHGYATGFFERAVESGVLEPVEETDATAKYELAEGDYIAHNDISNDEDGYADADWQNPESDVWAEPWLDEEFWMAAKGKMPFAPWGDANHPEGNDDTDSRYQWSITDNWTTKEHVDEWVEKDPSLDGYTVLLEKEDDPYTDDPDPYAYVDGDDVRCPETDEVHPDFVEILERLGLTYCEVSQSGAGVHALYKGRLPDDVKQANFDIDDEPWGENDELPSVEIYDGKKVCRVTGEHVPGTPEDVSEWDTDALDEVLDEHLDEDDRVDEVTHDTDSDEMRDYEPSATASTETTGDVRDVYAAIDRLDPHDLPLRTRQVGTESTGWEVWDPSSYRSSSSGESLHRAPNENTFYDHKTGRSFGVLGLFACEDGLISKPWSQLSGSDWWAAVEQAREAGADIPKYEPNSSSSEGDGVYIPRGEDSLSNVEKCEPPLYDSEELVPEERWNSFQTERYEAFLEHDSGEMWLDPAGTGKTTNAAIAAAKRDRSHAVLFDKHEKAREFQKDDATPDDYYHLKGGAQKRLAECMDADHAGEECPQHGHHEHCPSMCPIYDLDPNSDLRETYQAVVNELGPVEAHLILDPHDGEQCEWMKQFEEIKKRERVVGVHEYQMLKSVRDKDDVIIDEAPSELQNERKLSVEDLVRMSNTLSKLAKIRSGTTSTNAQEFADFADRLVEEITTDGGIDNLCDLEAPDFQWKEEQILDYTAGYAHPSHTDESQDETFADIKVLYSETVVQRMRDGEWNGAPVAMDALLAAADEAGLPSEPIAKAIATPATLEKCPRCSKKTEPQNGHRVCTECGWDETTGSLVGDDTELARASVRVERNKLEYRELPLTSTLPETPLILDATGTPVKAELLYKTEFETSGDDNVEANMHVTQVLNGQYHSGTLKDSESARERIQCGIDKACDLHDKVLTVGEQKSRELFDLPDNADWLHYHANRGLNRAEYDAVVVVGAPHAHVGDLKRTAELLGRHQEVRIGGAEHSNRRGAENPPLYRKLLYEDDDGRGRAVATKHYTGLVGELFRETREKEIEQTVHRLRPVLSDEMKHCYLFTNVPTDIEVDEVATFDELTQPLEVMLPVPERGVELFRAIAQTARGEGPDGFRAEQLLDVEDGAVEINKREAHQLARLHGLDVTYRTVCEWVNELEKTGLLAGGDYLQQEGVRYSQDVSTLKSALQVLSCNSGFKVAALQRLRDSIACSSSPEDWIRTCQELFRLSGDRCELDPPPS